MGAGVNVQYDGYCDGDNRERSEDSSNADPTADIDTMPCTYYAVDDDDEGCCHLYF